MARVNKRSLRTQKHAQKLITLGVCQIFYTSKIEIKQFFPRKCVNRNIFGQQLRMEDVLLIYFEQNVSFCAIIYSKTKSLQLFYESSSRNSANFKGRVFVCDTSWKFYPSPKIFDKSVTFATCDKFHVWNYLHSYSKWLNENHVKKVPTCSLMTESVVSLAML